MAIVNDATKVALADGACDRSRLILLRFYPSLDTLQNETIDHIEKLNIFTNVFVNYEERTVKQKWCKQGSTKDSLAAVISVKQIGQVPMDSAVISSC